MDYKTRIRRALGRRLIRNRALGAWVGRTLNARGDVLDPQLGVLLWLESVFGGPFQADRTMAERRAAFTASCWTAAGEPLDCWTEDRFIAGIRHRLYRPKTPVGTLVFFHGGGWTLGSIETHDVLCRRLAVASGRTVLSVDYPLAPETRWPDTVHFTARAFRTLAEVSEGPVAIGGDSAGANLATNACLILRQEGPAPASQFLLYPALDATRHLPSHQELGAGFILTTPSMDFHLEQFGPDPSHPLGSPLLTPNLADMPPALLVVAGFDPLRDEGLAYGVRLRDAGNDVELLDYSDTVHGFGNMDGVIDRARDYIDEMGRRLRVGR